MLTQLDNLLCIKRETYRIFISKDGNGVYVNVSLSYSPLNTYMKTN